MPSMPQREDYGGSGYGALPDDTKTYKRLCQSMIEETEAIMAYACRIALESDDEAKSVLEEAVEQEYHHFCMFLEAMLRTNPEWEKVAKAILFQSGDIVENNDAIEETEPSGAEETYSDDSVVSLPERTDSIWNLDPPPYSAA